MKKALEAFYKQRIDEAAGCRQQWKIVNELLHSRNETVPLADDECRRLAQGLSDFFISKVSSIRTTISHLLHCRPAASIVTTNRRNVPSSSMDILAPVTVDEVIKLTASMSLTSSPRDILPTSLLKTCISALAPAIAHMANLSFKLGCFPSGFKTGQILPLLKKPSLDSEVFANYRPISNMSTISKMIERLALV